jgi:hypothetical protein
MENLRGRSSVSAADGSVFAKNIASTKAAQSLNTPLTRKVIGVGANFSSERQPFPTDWHLCIRKPCGLAILKMQQS